jgi:hypothetical protein
VDHPKDLKIGPNKKGRHSMATPKPAAACPILITLK